MPESFGVRLRQRRERQKIELSAIADRTKIKRSLLEELERDDVSHWPVGIFRRAFIRAYGQAIGLEPDVLLREFLELHPDPTEVVAVPGAALASEGPLDTSGPPTRFGDLVRGIVRRLSGRSDAMLGREGAAPELAPAKRTTVKTRSFELDLPAAAQLCTELGRVDTPTKLPPLLQEAARILDAIGLIVWLWDPEARGLRPALAHGYSDAVLAHLPTVGRDAHNATAAAFRSAHACTVKGGDHSSGALVVPLITGTGCDGVLAIELQGGGEEAESVRAFATIVAAQLARSIGTDRPAAANADNSLATFEAAGRQRV